MGRDRGSGEKSERRSYGGVPEAIGRNPASPPRDCGAGNCGQKSADEAANDNPALSGASANDGADESAEATENTRQNKEEWAANHDLQR